MDERDTKDESQKKKSLKIRRKLEERVRTKLLKKLDEDPNDFLKEVSSRIKAYSTTSNSNHQVLDLLSMIEEELKSTTGGKDTLLECVRKYREGEDESETLLHIAVKYKDDLDIIRKIVEICPHLLIASRENSKNYKGQTPLHIAITKRDYEVTEILLSAFDLKFTDTITKTRATGRIFTNTVMMGELPLNVAALTFEEDIVDLLLKYDVKMHEKNGCGDTVFHSLVKYSAVYPNKTDNVITMFSHLIEKIKNPNSSHFQYQGMDTDIHIQEDSYVWFLENHDSLTPLQLSAKLGVVDIFQFMIKIENVYSFVSTHDGLFDVKLYDISEIDTVANQHLAAITNAKEENKNRKVSKNIDGVSHKSINSKMNCNPFKCSQVEYPKTESILDMMFDYDYQSQSAFRIIETIPVKNIILEKWKKLRYMYFIWGFVHMLMTVLITVELVLRSDLYALQTTSNTTMLNIHVPVSSTTLATIISWLSLIIGGAIYSIMIILLLIAKARRPNAIRYIFHNLGYLVFLIVYSVCLYIDFIMTITNDKHDNIALILAVIAGWWFSVFFLRAFRLFSFFTEMIRRVIIGDLLRFSVIISFMLFAFTAGMYASFVGSMHSEQLTSTYQDAVNTHFSSFGAAMLTMFNKLMLGLDDFGVLNEARIPGLAISLYIVFALLTYVLLMNSLIAMMSQTCAVVLEDRYPQWRLQQLSVVLFLEDVFCLFCIRHIFRSPGTKFCLKEGEDKLTQDTKRLKVRYFFKIHSLQTTYASEEDREAMKNTRKENEQIGMGESLRPHHETYNYDPKTGNESGLRRQKSENKLTDVETTSKISVDTDRNINQDCSSRQSKQSRRVLEQKTGIKQPTTKIKSEHDLIEIPHSIRYRYHLKNMQGKYVVSSPANASTSSVNVRSQRPLNDFDHKLHVHDHPDHCPEKRIPFIPNRHSHVDIEPYQ